MRITVDIDGEARRRLQDLAGARLPELRRQAVEAAARQALTETILQNPVETARSRAAWVASLQQLGGAPPTGWQGPRPTGEADGRRQGRLDRTHDRDVTAVAAGNAVQYVPFLEYGTRRSAPFAMVRRALARARQSLLARLRLLLR